MELPEAIATDEVLRCLETVDSLAAAEMDAFGDEPMRKVRARTDMG